MVCLDVSLAELSVAFCKGEAADLTHGSMDALRFFREASVPFYAAVKQEPATLLERINLAGRIGPAWHLGKIGHSAACGSEPVETEDLG